MKKIILIMMLFVAGISFAMADNDKPITVDQLPVAVQNFIKQHFPDKKVALAKKESDIFYSTYDVIFTDGNKIEFDSKGNWEEVNCKYSSVPVEVVPAEIKKYIKSNYPDAKVLKIERDRGEFDVKLNNRVELKFNSKFQLIDIDMD